VGFWVAFSEVIIIVRLLIREGWIRYRQGAGCFFDLLCSGQHTANAVFVGPSQRPAHRMAVVPAQGRKHFVWGLDLYGEIASYRHTTPRTVPPLAETPSGGTRT
jgi:hypothetical protein